jgi:hypothetical protein
MIVFHQNNVAAFAGNHVVIWLGQPILRQRVSVTSAAAANNLIEQARSVARFTHTRIFGRVN